MGQNALDRAASLAAYPNIRGAAELIDVSASTLSRRKDLRIEPRGERDLVLPPSEVLRLAAIYRKRSLNDVAQGLIEHARSVSPDAATQVESEVESFFEGRVISEDRRVEFLALARRLLPASLYERVEETVSKQHDPLPEALIGHPPPPES